jgi:hypothetical protein
MNDKESKQTNKTDYDMHMINSDRKNKSFIRIKMFILQQGHVIFDSFAQFAVFIQSLRYFL